MKFRVVILMKKKLFYFAPQACDFQAEESYMICTSDYDSDTEDLILDGPEL